MEEIYNVYGMYSRFDKLNLSCLHMDERYLETMEKMFKKEIAILRDRYNADRQEPTLPMNVTPFAGRIMWIRQLFKRISEPMEIFKTRKRVYNSLYLLK